MTAILDNKNPSAASVFRPSALLREARRQKGLAAVDVPSICILDPDGDIVRQLRRTGAARPFEGWPCYHTTLDTFVLAEQTVGIVGCAVGAPFAVLVAEQLFACGCRLLLSITSAGQITTAGNPPYFVIIDRALRDEGGQRRALRRDPARDRSRGVRRADVGRGWEGALLGARQDRPRRAGATRVNRRSRLGNIARTGSGLTGTRTRRSR